MVVIYADAYEEGVWFKKLDPRLKNADMVRYGDSNPPIIKSLLKYDRPDVIMTIDGVPILVIERTESVPTGNSAGQRFGRLARAVELGVPTIYMCPAIKQKDGDPCWLNPWLIRGTFNMNRLHDTSLVPIRWPENDDYTLKSGDIVDKNISKVITKFINDGFQNLNFCFDNNEYREATMREFNEPHKEAVDRNNSWPYTKGRCNHTVYDTDDYTDKFNTNFSSEFKSRDGTVEYMTRTSEKRCDPYTGMLFLFDYSLCRYGKYKSQRRRNLVFKLPKFTKSEWFDKFPLDTDSKGSMLYESADAVVFKDQVLHLTE